MAPGGIASAASVLAFLLAILLTICCLYVHFTVVSNTQMCGVDDASPLRCKSNPAITKTAGFCNNGAGGGTRTHTPSLATDFESASSTSSNTPASPKDYSTEFRRFQVRFLKFLSISTETWIRYWSGSPMDISS